MSNPFLTKKDPLLEAVKGAMQDGELRRQAEALVNEEFGVYSRKAVVREQLAAYDARLEEAYKCMKEGGQIDEIKVSTAYSYAGKKMEKERKGLLPGDRNPSSKTDLKNMKNAAERTDKDYYKNRGFKKVDEAKLAKKDYDKDGKIESPKDEVWGSRFRAAKMAGKMEEALKGNQHRIDANKNNKIDSQDFKLLRARKKMDEEQIDEVSKKTLGSYIKKAASKKPYTSIHGAAYDAVSGDPRARKTIQKREKGIERATDRLTKEETQIDEISKGLALKAMKKSEKRGEEEYDRDMAYDRLSHHETHFDRAKKLRGHMKRKFGNKTIKTGGADNLSSKSYEQGGGERHRADKLTKGPRAGMISARHRDKLKGNIKYSLGKHKKPNLPEGYELDEAAYSAKAARAGKDIGKPGKKFSEIAAKAGKRYGSEERGKKVAGAILAKIRAKHMKEADVSSNYSGSKMSDTGHSGTYHGDVSYKSSAERMKSGKDYVDPHRTEIKNDKNYPGL